MAQTPFLLVFLTGIAQNRAVFLNGVNGELNGVNLKANAEKVGSDFSKENVTRFCLNHFKGYVIKTSQSPIRFGCVKLCIPMRNRAPMTLKLQIFCSNISIDI